MTPPDQRTDQELVALALRDRHAFVAIVERYQAPLQRYIARLGCQDSSDQEDVLQEVFLKVYLNLNEYDPGLKFSSWVYRIAHNETISFFRKKNVRPAPVLTEKELEQFGNISDGTDIAASYARKWDVEQLRLTLAGLEEQYRDVLVLKFIEEKSYNEISDILKIPIGTVGTLINRGKKQLSRIFKEKNI